ncbi:MAG: nuclear transport factor 2 family protein [Gemmatimonadaceae bacterium]
MANPTVDQELADLERKYWQAMKDKDVETAVQLTDEPCIITGAQGVSRIDRESYRKLMTEAKWELVDYEFSDMQTQRVTDDVAVVAYKVKEKLTVEGKPVSFEASDSSTWVKRNGQWRCAVHTEAVSGDPFGRDRQSAK